MRVLIGCECSGIVREAFRALGHDAYSCDLKRSEDRSEFHYRCDVRRAIGWGGWDMAIFHPDCTLFNNASAWAIPDPDFVRFPGAGYHQKVKPETLTGAARRVARAVAAEFFLHLWNCGIPKIAIENPTGYMNTHPAMAGALTQTIQPYQFGDDASKATCLWLRGLPPLVPTKYVEPRAVCTSCDFCEPAAVEVREEMFAKGCPECGADASKIRPRWSNQTDSGQNKLTPSKTRATDRARTYPGIAEAMAKQWGKTTEPQPETTAP